MSSIISFDLKSEVSSDLVSFLFEFMFLFFVFYKMIVIVNINPSFSLQKMKQVSL